MQAFWQDEGLQLLCPDADFLCSLQICKLGDLPFGYWRHHRLRGIAVTMWPWLVLEQIQKPKNSDVQGAASLFSSFFSSASSREIFIQLRLGFAGSFYAVQNLWHNANRPMVQREKCTVKLPLRVFTYSLASSVSTGATFHCNRKIILLCTAESRLHRRSELIHNVFDCWERKVFTMNFI